MVPTTTPRTFLAAVIQPLVSEPVLMHGVVLSWCRTLFFIVLSRVFFAGQLLMFLKVLVCQTVFWYQKLGYFLLRKLEPSVFSI